MLGNIHKIASEEARPLHGLTLSGGASLSCISGRCGWGMQNCLEVLYKVCKAEVLLVARCYRKDAEPSLRRGKGTCLPVRTGLPVLMRGLMGSRCSESGRGDFGEILQPWGL